ncbi:pyrroline-5-carboxylate reductase [Neisseria sp. Ec49-e6-T10]|uniref:pyrroline-5-carboxylate reductase n=1 Tax=Neisseria sp. Ec49-e6-T10 TaxID=3140744 RepID=UPI003EB7A1D0
MDKTIGFIGCGNMGSAIVKGILNQQLFSKDKIWVSDRQNARAIAEQLGIQYAANTEIAKQDIIVLAVKPNIMAKVLAEIKPLIQPHQIIVTIAVGLTIRFYKDILGDNIKLVRVMPNTPVAVGEGMSTLTCEAPVTEEDQNTVRSIFNAIGQTAVIDEYLMNTASAVAGSSPALVDLFIEAMADGAVRHGLPRQIAYEMVTQAILGSAKLARDTKIHPGVLKDQVCSPAGTTIEAVTTLEKHNFRYAVIDAITECVKKADKMS